MKGEKLRRKHSLGCARSSCLLDTLAVESMERKSRQVLDQTAYINILLVFYKRCHIK